MRHVVIVRRRRVTVVGGRIPAGSRGTDVVELVTDSDYDGLEVTLVLGSGDRAVATVYSGPVTIPSELTLTPGHIAVSVVGRSPDGGVVVTEEAPEAMEVVAGGTIDARED